MQLNGHIMASVVTLAAVTSIPSLVPRPSLSLSSAITILEAGKKEVVSLLLEAGKKEVVSLLLSFLPPKLLLQKKAREKAWERG